MEKLEEGWIKENPLMAAGVFAGAGTALVFAVLYFMGKIKK